MYVGNDNIIHYCCNDISKENKKKINSYVKHWLLDSGKYDMYRCTQKAIYYSNLRDKLVNNIDLDENEKGFDFEFVIKQCSKYSNYLGLDLCLTDYEYKCCIQIFNNKRKRVQRLRKKIKNIILTHDCLFLTLTFRNKVLDSTSEQTRRVYISRYLKQFNFPFYVANIDYGELNEREHYHAIVQTDFIDCKLYKYGIIKVECVRKDEYSIKKIPTYINKLSAHAFKDSTGQCRLIYSKPIRKNVVKLFKDSRIDNFHVQKSL